jgi:hypothetical protein
MEWLRRRARWLIRDEIRQVTADLAIARADALDALVARDRIADRLQHWAGAMNVGDQCTKVQLHSEGEAVAWAEKIGQNTASDDALYPYPCKVCRHPIATIWHVAHHDQLAAGGTERERAEARRNRRLIQRVSADRLQEIRDRLAGVIVAEADGMGHDQAGRR